MQLVGLLPRQVFDAVKEYGLRLEARQAPIEMITVKRLERRRRRTEALGYSVRPDTSAA
jgi:hypothetical protein